jgi:hypothetical protein
LVAVRTSHALALVANQTVAVVSAVTDIAALIHAAAVQTRLSIGSTVRINDTCGRQETGAIDAYSTVRTLIACGAAIQRFHDNVRVAAGERGGAIHLASHDQIAHSKTLCLVGCAHEYSRLARLGEIDEVKIHYRLQVAVVILIDADRVEERTGLGCQLDG